MMLVPEDSRSISGIGNEYGGLSVWADGNSSYFWGIEGGCGHAVQEITEELYFALTKFQDGVEGK